MIDVFMYNIIPFLVVLTVLVYVHELGHYWIARINGVHVEVFSIGFGPEIFGWTNKHGTRWRISLVPLGGYVRMLSDADASSKPDHEKLSQLSPEEFSKTLHSKTVWQKMAVTAAGPGANYIFALIVMVFLFVFSGEKIPVSHSEIGSVVEGKPAAAAGIRAGDVIISLGGKGVSSFPEMQKVLQERGQKPLTVTLKRGTEIRTVMLTPEVITTRSGEKIVRIGVSQGYRVEKKTFFRAIPDAISSIWDMTAGTVVSLGQMIMGTKPSDGLSGPIGIATITGEMAQKGWIDVIWLMAILSVNLGLINLFPVPVLDGGHLLFYGIEAIRGRPVSEKAQEYAYRIGFALIMVLIIFSTWNDLSRLKVFQWVSGILAF